MQSTKTHGSPPPATDPQRIPAFCRTPKLCEPSSIGVVTTQECNIGGRLQHRSIGSAPHQSKAGCPRGVRPFRVLRRCPCSSPTKTNPVSHHSPSRRITTQRLMSVPVRCQVTPPCRPSIQFLVRRVRASCSAASFQIPPHGGHLCLLTGGSRSPRPAGVLHPLETHHAWRTLKTQHRLPSGAGPLRWLS